MSRSLSCSMTLCGETLISQKAGLMADFSFIHAADIHLDSPLSGLSAYEGAPVDLLRSAPRVAFSHLVDEAINLGVDFMIIAGDLYDGNWKDFNTGLFFSAEMGRLKQKDIPVFIVYGNHDADNEMTRQLMLPENVTVFSPRKAETQVLPELGVALHGHSFGKAKMQDNLAVDYPPPVAECFNIGVLHTAVEGDAAHASYAPCSLADLTGKGYDYWALGHVHEHKILNETPLVVFPGNLQGRHIRETGAHGAVLVRVADNQPVIERLLVDTVRWHKISIDAEQASSLEDVVLLARDRLEKLVRQNVDKRPLAVRVVFSGHSRAHGELFGLEAQLRLEILNNANALGDNELWIEKVILETEPALDAAALATRSDAIADLQGILARAGSDRQIKQLIMDDLIKLVGKAPLELIDAMPELEMIKNGEIDEQLEKVSQGLIARLVGERGAP